MAQVKAYEATIKDGDRVIRLFASDSKKDAEDWFKMSYKESTRSNGIPSEDEIKYFMDGHDVILTQLDGRILTWHLNKNISGTK